MTQRVQTTSSSQGPHPDIQKSHQNDVRSQMSRKNPGSSKVSNILKSSHSGNFLAAPSHLKNTFCTRPFDESEPSWLRARNPHRSALPRPPVLRKGGQVVQSFGCGSQIPCTQCVPKGFLSLTHGQLGKGPCLLTKKKELEIAQVLLNSHQKKTSLPTYSPPPKKKKKTHTHNCPPAWRVIKLLLWPS